MQNRRVIGMLDRVRRRRERERRSRSESRERAGGADDPTRFKQLGASFWENPKEISIRRGREHGRVSTIDDAPCARRSMSPRTSSRPQRVGGCSALTAWAIAKRAGMSKAKVVLRASKSLLQLDEKQRFSKGTTTPASRSEVAPLRQWITSDRNPPFRALGAR